MALIDFGDNFKGNVNIGDVADGDLIKVSVNQAPQPAQTKVSKPAKVKAPSKGPSVTSGDVAGGHRINVFSQNGNTYVEIDDVLFLAEREADGSLYVVIKGQRRKVF